MRSVLEAGFIFWWWGERGGSSVGPSGPGSGEGGGGADGRGEAQ
jgi:hypothetical protein